MDASPKSKPRSWRTSKRARKAWFLTHDRADAIDAVLVAVEHSASSVRLNFEAQVQRAPTEIARVGSTPFDDENGSLGPSFKKTQWTELGCITESIKIR